MIPHDKLFSIAERYESDLTQFRLSGDVMCLIHFLEAVAGADRCVLKDDFFNAKNALYFLTSMNKSFQVY